MRLPRCARLIIGHAGPPLLLACLLSAAPSSAAGACRIERSADAAGPFRLHLGSDCTDQERDAQALRAADVVTMILDGRAVDISGAVIVGDLDLAASPPRPVEAVALPDRIRRTVLERRIERVHLLPTALSIRHSRLRGTLRGSVDTSVVLASGPVTLSGTTFEQLVDLSRTVFLGPVDFSGAILLQQAFFIEALFDQPASFEKTAFGPHSRFHKAVFEEDTSFHRAGFNGLAEFIQVRFNKTGRFSQTYFKDGTGFSGSRFHGLADFSESTFDRDAYFSFAVFDTDAYFRRATFRSQASFNDAQFHGVDDFSKTWFNVEPQFTRAKVSDQAIGKGLQDSRVLYIIAAALLAFSLIFGFILRRG